MRIVVCLMPHVHVLVRQVHRQLGILLDTPMERLDTNVAGIGAIVREKQEARAPEARLELACAGLEERVVADGHLDRLVGGRVELGWRRVWELQDL